MLRLLSKLRKNDQSKIANKQRNELRSNKFLKKGIKRGFTLGLALAFLLTSAPASMSWQTGNNALLQSTATGGNVSSSASAAKAKPKIVQKSTSASTQVNPNLTGIEDQAQGLTGRLVVKLSPGTSAETIAEQVKGQIARKGPLQFITLAFDSNRMDEVTKELKSMPGVLSVSPTQKVKLSAAGSASPVTDPHYSEQWGLSKAEVPKAWNLGATGKGITVAVVDTGVDINHPDLQDNLVSGYNAITGETGLSAVQDNNGHGTHVSGIIAAELNGVGVVGVSYQAKIMPIKTMDRSGEGTDDVIADGIVWAADHGANIINLSLGSDTQEAILKEAVQYAIDQGCLVVAAGGNKEDSTNLTTITYPAADPQVLAVTATDANDNLASFSLSGLSAGIAAPGMHIVSDYWNNGSGYATSDGTSMAAPFVSGVAALVWSMHSDFSADHVRQVLEDSAIDLGSPGRDSSFGYGRVDAYWAVKFADQPESLPASANVSWAGGILQGGTTTTPATLTIPSRAFGSDPTLTPKVEITTPTGIASLPSGVNPIGQPVSVALGISTSVRKQLQLSMTPDYKTFAPDSSHLFYIYRWSGSRWLKVGGGVSSNTVTVGITEPGIYQIGSASIPQGNRLAGADRLETAIQISQAGFPDGADTVILARAEDFPDALAGVPLAYKYHAPILLTNSTSLSDSVFNEIKRLNPQQIILLGGTGAISGGIEQELQNMYNITRLGGANRYATAQQIAEALGMTGEAIIVNGDNFPDAISISSIAAQNGVPILLTQSNNVPSETNQPLRKFAVSFTLAVGGEGVISSDTLDSLPNPLRLSGQDRYETAAQVLSAFPPQGGMTFLATGENFPDALTGGVLAALNSTDLVLISPTGLQGKEKTAIQSWHGQKVFAFGGNGVVSDSILTYMETLLR
ncbi:cell wall-binding repeat-containing protein [Desulfitobacterium sp. AusDCA]|uniref:cell wall-binding repeat-containing protein n=1 Tax=Desulfitobacterium sp. AusDCA TaxID=3240383 RepID=UPI003DA7A083